MSQQLENEDRTSINGDVDTLTQYFSVRGDRFSLTNHAAVISSVFPADNASGEFSTVLPNVVFTKTTFPWIRCPSDAAPPYVPGTNVSTWLYVMLLDEDDVQTCASQYSTTLELRPMSCTLGDLFPASAVTTSTLGFNYSYFNGSTKIPILEPGEELGNPIQAIDIPLELFWQIAPTLDDLKQLAHGRMVSLTAGATQTGGIPTGSYSTVFSNRLPNSGKKTWAYLVSLENLGDLLLQTGGIPPTGYNTSKSIRLAVLKSWTFFSTGETASFVEKLKNLNAGGTLDTNLVLDYAGINPTVKASLNMGYVPLNETLRTGEVTVSWYRGPLAPYSV